MEKIPSFQKNHDALAVGLHVQTDKNGISTFDLRFKKPNAGDYITPKALHTIEHLMATVLRNSREKENIVYFGPMGCRTGFYVIFSGDLQSEDIIDVLREMADYILKYEGEIPGYSPRDCGNYLDNNLKLAQIYMKKFKEEVLDNPTPERLVYPQ